MFEALSLRGATYGRTDLSDRKQTSWDGKELLCKHNQKALPLTRYEDLAPRKVCTFRAQLVFCMQVRQPNAELVCWQCMHYHVLTASWTVLHALLAMALLVRIVLQTLEHSCRQQLT